MDTNLSNDITILSHLKDTLTDNPDATQRDIAQHTGLSLGMTNAMLKRFIDKGWVMMHRLTPKKVTYVLTTQGMHEVASRTYHYMQHTFKLMNQYGQAMLETVARVKREGYTEIILCGDCDVAFLLEYACKSGSVHFIKQNEAKLAGENKNHTAFVIFADQKADAVLQKNQTTLYKILYDKEYV
ncbi:MAG: winged helix-turn-helix transcriptional regulator [Treponema sp.]|nr:winged helix-turn-helix transcriptional regulator [Treponema sp.]